MTRARITAGVVLLAGVIPVLAVTGILGVLFAWPDGIVVGNLIASAMWAAPAMLHLHRRIAAGERHAAASRQIAADTYRHVTGGRDHHLAPRERSEP